MKTYFLYLLFLILFRPLVVCGNNDSLLSILNQTIDKQDIFIKEKNDRIQNHINKLNTLRDRADLAIVNIYQSLYDEYRSYQYDSAFKYAALQLHAASAIGDKTQKARAKLNITFVLRSSGMYKEAYDSLYSIRPDQLPDSLALEYYDQMARTYFDLAAFNSDDHFRMINSGLGINYVDSAIQLCKSKNLQYYSLIGLKAQAEGKQREALDIFQAIVNDFDIDEHQFAMAAFSLGKIYESMGDIQKYEEMIIKSTIADIRSCTKETMASLELAKYMYKLGEVEHASKYIRQAARDSEFYGANLRIVQVSAILPIIENAMLTSAQYKSKRLFNFLMLVILVTILVITFSLIIYRQYGKLNTTKKNLSTAYERQHKLNDQLLEANDKLHEANIIKEQYIGYSFTKDSDYLRKMDKLKQAISRKLVDKEYENIDYVLKQFNPEKEKAELYQKFDDVFLKLFPNFITHFNALFNKEDQFMIKEGQPLPTELRIFALIRIGITEHEQIASILGYSVRTVYNYKNKIKGLSFLPNEEFETALMQIKTFE